MNFTFEELKMEIGNMHLQMLAMQKLIVERDAKIAQLEVEVKKLTPAPAEPTKV